MTPGPPPTPLVPGIALSESDGQELRRIALTTLREYAFTGGLPPGAPHRPSLLAKSGAAVHLYRGSELCGRALLLEPEHPLYYAVELAAVQAGYFDPCGDRVGPSDAERLTLVVTVVGARQPIGEGELAAIDPSSQALVLRRGPLQGAYTPECVRAHGWDREGLLAAIRRSVDAAAGGELVWAIHATLTFGPPARSATDA